MKEINMEVKDVGDHISVEENGTLLLFNTIYQTT